MANTEVEDFIRRYTAAWASREPGVMAGMWHADGELHHPALSAPIPGHRVASNNDNSKRLPDFEWRLLDWAAQGKVVFLHWQTRATIRGRPRAWQGVDRMELRDGRVEREDVYFDTVPLRMALDPTARFAPLVDVRTLGADAPPRAERPEGDPVRRNVRRVEQYYEAWQAGRPEAIAEFFAASFRGHVGGEDLDLAGLLKIRGLLAKSFPDQRLETLDVIARGERVVARWRSRATFRAELDGVPPTNGPVACSGVTIYRLEAERIVELWDYRDPLELLDRPRDEGA